MEKSLNYLEVFKLQTNFMKNNLSKSEKEAIVDYSGSDYYKEFNETLRDKGKNALRGKLLSIYEGLNSIFSRIPSLSFPILTYRGIRGDTVNVGYLEKQFISTTMAKDVALEFKRENCCLMEITIPAGVKCLPIFEYSENKDEYEIVLPPGYKWVINDSNDGIFSMTVLRSDSLLISQIGGDLRKAEVKFEKAAPVLIKNKIEDVSRLKNLYDRDVLEMMYDGNFEEYAEFLISQAKLGISKKEAVGILKEIYDEEES